MKNTKISNDSAFDSIEKLLAVKYPLCSACFGKPSPLQPRFVWFRQHFRLEHGSQSMRRQQYENVLICNLAFSNSRVKSMSFMGRNESQKGRKPLHTSFPFGETYHIRTRPKCVALHPSRHAKVAFMSCNGVFDILGMIWSV
jgi:hypothetical protein